MTDSLVGKVLDRKYMITRLIAKGGMGTVWLSRQSEPVKRNVALKIIKLGMDTEQVVARFEMERQRSRIDIVPMTLSDAEIAALVAFLHSLTGTGVGSPPFGVPTDFNP